MKRDLPRHDPKPRTRVIGDSGSAGSTDAVHEDLLTLLGRDPLVEVHAAVLPQPAAAGRREIASIGRRLHVAYTVEGGVQRGPRGMRVTLRLIRSSDAVLVWAEAFEDDSRDEVAAAERIAVLAGGAIHDRLVLEGGGTGQAAAR
jgi:TolB-like protein